MEQTVETRQEGTCAGACSPLKYSRPEYDIAKTDPHWADVKMVNMIGTGKHVLEMGCASGHFGKYLKNHASCKVWAVEIDKKLADQASPYYERIYVGDIQNEEVIKQIQPKDFDVILCSNVLEHTPRPLDILKCLKPFLKKQGFFVIALPNIAHFTIRLRLLFGNFDPDLGILGEDHLRYYTLKTARQLLDSAGLKVVEWGIDSDKGIPKFDGLLRKFPPVGPKLLDWFYSLRPTLFGFQFMFKCESA